MKPLLSFLLFLFLFVYSCSNIQKQNSFTNVFNQEQKELIFNLLKKNDSVLQHAYKVNIDAAYQKQFDQFKQAEGVDDLLDNVFFSNKDLLERFEEVGFFIKEQIRTYDPVTKKMIVKNDYEFELNLNSAYLEYLKNLSETNATIKDYYESIVSSGAISPGSTAKMIHIFPKIGFNDDNFRIIIGIHFLWFNQAKFNPH